MNLFQSDFKIDKPLRLIELFAGYGSQALAFKRIGAKNAKDYGVPQNRERCFMFSFLGDGDYEFPEAEPLTKRLKDVLEDEVDEKYSINSEKAQQLIERLFAAKLMPEDKAGVDLCANNTEIKEISVCISARYDRGISNHINEHTGIVERK